MSSCILNPKDHLDWDARLLRSGDHSFFHTSAWARVLEAAYGFKPLYFTEYEGERFSLLMPMMETSGLLKGRRGVSLPFTDRCAPHVGDRTSLAAAIQKALAYGKNNGWRMIEWRDDKFGPAGTPAWASYLTHDIDLRKSEEDLFTCLSPSNRRNIRKSLREGVFIRIGRSLESLRSFYQLNCLTRKRHGLPPQPYSFFKNVHEHIVSHDLGLVFSAYHAEKLIAAAVFFHFGSQCLFKYGASELDPQRLRPNNLIIWEAMKWYGRRGFVGMNLGRTEPSNLGLLRFKRAWGGTESPLRYFRLDVKSENYIVGRPRSYGSINRIFERTPTGILQIMGRVFYRYFG